jgi:Xaa-Pro aminopeptidase
MDDRLTQMRRVLRASGPGALLVSNIENVRYLSGFSGSSACAVITPRNATLVTDGRYREQAGRESPSWDIVIYEKDLIEAIARLLSGDGEIGFEVTASYDFHEKLSSALGDKTVLKPAHGLVEELRARKTSAEVGSIRDALSCAWTAFDLVVPLIVPGVSERRVAAELDYRMMLAGADRPAFDTVVASGPNSSMPHAGISDRVIEERDLVVVDFGASKDGYCSDSTRTLVVGEPDERQREVLEAVTGAQREAIAALEPGMAASEADRVARACLERIGFGANFSHSLGHGVGLEVHELPTLAPRSKDVLRPGMVFTVEPGVYIAGWGGARFEDVVHMTEDGPTVLSG